MTRNIEVTQDLRSCFDLRHQVFVVEQGVPAREELDHLDETATHLLAHDVLGPVGTARIVFDGDVAKIGRVCVLERARGSGLGADLIRKAVELCEGTAGIVTVRLGAQLHALSFYRKLGFVAVGPTYLDAGIEHQDMSRELT
ncbi:drug:proton antiporter [Ruegeria sp. ANG-R]|uniref:GNAT family N-acetyltransferase n=1 Tax=Ruegeria sp. ANG-R TaxID=1577903 RepID=UPI00057C520B|nr:GNAT family N-acetyltransferase [Ruegeria sp. ANG-R]KIC40696.1 drug:proton antiporter [Ruegeria sp. ANG-R]